jgi:hypothetical protein
MARKRLTDEERSQRRLKRSLARLMDVMFDSPIQAAEWEAAGTIVTDFPPSRYNLGPMLKIQQPDTYCKTWECTEDELRRAEAIAFEDDRPEMAGRIAFYRHARFGCAHPDGYLGELGWVDDQGGA